MKSLSRCVLVAGLFTASNLTLPAATHFVQIRDYYFTPTNLNINVGDTVVWTNAAEITHDATSTQGLWASANIQPHATYLRSFTNAGTFPYICQQHIFTRPEQTGQVIVATANLPPPIAITNPHHNARFLALANFPIELSVSNGVTLTNVQFFQNGQLLSESPFPPFQGFANDLVAGTFTFVARAQNNLGVASTSAPVVIQVLTNSIISGPLRSGSGFQFTVNATTGQTYVAEYSTNLANWQPFATNTNAAAVFNFSDTNATSSPRFYRVKQDF